MWIHPKTQTSHILMESSWLTLTLTLITVLAHTCASTPTLRPSSRPDSVLVDDDIWGDDARSSPVRTTRAHRTTSVSVSNTDVLSRLEDRLRSMDAANVAAKSARSDYVLEQVSRRLDSIESKLSRLEIKFDVRLEKVEEVVMAKEIKEEFATDQLSRQIENMGDKVANKLGFLEAKMGLRIDNLSSRLDRSERQLQGSLDDVLEKMVKTDDKQMQSEARIWSRIDKMEDASSGVQDLRLYVREELGGFMSKRFHEIGHKIDKGFEEAKDTAERRHGAIEELTESVEGIQTNIDEILRRMEEGNANHTCDWRARAKTGGATAAPDEDSESYSLHLENAHPKMELFTLQTSAKLSNLTSSVAEAMQFGEKKFKELDRDVEIYTRKVLNAYQEVLKGTTKLEAHLSSALNQGNQTRLVIQEGFRKLSQQLQPLTNLAPRMDEMTEDFEKRMEELSTIVDERFASLLVSQNTFIASCHRIQNQEPQFEKRIGDMLQEVKEDVQSRLATSASDTRFLRTALNNHNVQIGKALNDLVWTLLSVGNQTKTDLRSIAVQVSTMQQLQRSSRHTAPSETVMPQVNAEFQCSCLINSGDWGTLSQACGALKGKPKAGNPLPKEAQDVGQKTPDLQRAQRRHHRQQRLLTTTPSTMRKPVPSQKQRFDSELLQHDQPLPVAMSTSEELDVTMLPPFLEDLQLAHVLQQSMNTDGMVDANKQDNIFSSDPEHPTNSKDVHEEQAPKIGIRHYLHKTVAQSRNFHLRLNPNTAKHKLHADYSDPLDDVTDSKLAQKFSETPRGKLHPTELDITSSPTDEDNDKKTSNEYDYEDDYSDDYDK